MTSDILTDQEWFEDGDDELLDDEFGREANARLHGQLELFPELPPSTRDGNHHASFTIERQNLHDLAQVTNLYKDRQKKEKIFVGIKIYGNRIQIVQTRNSVMCRATAPLGPNPSGVPNGTLAFGFPHWQLAALGSQFLQPRRRNLEPLRCNLDLTKALWLIQCETAIKLRLTTHPVPNHECWSEEIQQPRHVTEFDPRVLGKALACTNQVAKKNRHQPQFGVVEVANGYARGGSPEGLAIFEAPALNGLRLRIAAEDVKLVRLILSRMQAGKTAFYETDTHQIIRDGVIECIIERPTVHFPLTEKLLAETPTDSFFVPAKDLAESVKILALHITRTQPDVFVELEHGGEHGSKMNLFIPAPKESERPGTATIATWPVDGAAETARTSRMTISLRSLMRLFPNYASPMDSIEIGIFDRRRLALTYKNRDERFLTRAYISESKA